MSHAAPHRLAACRLASDFQESSFAMRQGKCRLLCGCWASRCCLNSTTFFDAVAAAAAGHHSEPILGLPGLLLLMRRPCCRMLLLLHTAVVAQCCPWPADVNISVLSVRCCCCCCSCCVLVSHWCCFQGLPMPVQVHTHGQQQHHLSARRWVSQPSHHDGALHRPAVLPLRRQWPSMPCFTLLPSCWPSVAPTSSAAILCQARPVLLASAARHTRATIVADVGAFAAAATTFAAAAATDLGLMAGAAVCRHHQVQVPPSAGAAKCRCRQVQAPRRAGAATS